MELIHQLRLQMMKFNNHKLIKFDIKINQRKCTCSDVCVHVCIFSHYIENLDFFLSSSLFSLVCICMCATVFLFLFFVCTRAIIVIYTYKYLFFVSVVTDQHTQGTTRFLVFLPICV